MGEWGDSPRPWCAEKKKEKGEGKKAAVHLIPMIGCRQLVNGHRD